MTTQPSDWAVARAVEYELGSAMPNPCSPQWVFDAIMRRARELDASGDAPRAAEAGDTERLDWIERTYSGMTNRERYLPVVMIWGKAANGRTLREAIDKYMAKETPFTGVTFVERDMPPGVVAEVRTRYDRVTIVESDDDAAMGAVGAVG